MYRGRCVKIILIALCLSISVMTPANAACLFRFGNTCPIDTDIAAKILMPRVNGTKVGSFKFEQTFLFDTLRLGKSEPKAGDNIRRLARANSVRSYMNGSNDCSQVEAVWEVELKFGSSKQNFCEVAQLMKLRN